MFFVSLYESNLHRNGEKKRERDDDEEKEVEQGSENKMKRVIEMEHKMDN